MECSWGIREISNQQHDKYGKKIRENTDGPFRSRTEWVVLESPEHGQVSCCATNQDAESSFSKWPLTAPFTTRGKLGSPKFFLPPKLQVNQTAMFQHLMASTEKHQKRLHLVLESSQFPGDFPNPKTPPGAVKCQPCMLKSWQYA